MKKAVKLTLASGAAWASLKAGVRVVRAVRLARDWPSLAYYREANHVLGPPADHEHRVVFIGDSITQDWARTPRGIFERHDFINRGIGGQTTPQILLRFPSDVLALRPSLAVIQGGGNDVAGNTGPITGSETVANLRAMVQLARADGITPVLCSLLPVCDYYLPQSAKTPPAALIALNAAIQKLGRQEAVEYVDLYTPLLDQTGVFGYDLTYDGVHPNEAGYERLGSILLAAIQKIHQPNAVKSSPANGG